MRIRKNAARILCPLSLSAKSFISKAEEDAEAAAMAGGDEKRLCLLNQSPWDAMFFGSTPREITPCLYKGEEQREETASVRENRREKKRLEADREKEDIFRVNAGAAKKEKKPEEKNNKNNHKRKKKKNTLEEGKIPIVMCKKTDGKGWRCKREVQPSHALCEHHLAQLRSYSGKDLGIEEERKTSASKKKKKKKEPRIIDEIGGKSDLLSSDFFYYSGFGPRWRKRRSAGDTTAISEVTDDANDDGMDVNRIARKPIKARSLMSLL